MGLLPSGRLALAVSVITLSTLTFAATTESGPGSRSTRPLVTQKIDNASLSPLEKNVRPELNAATDLGPVEDSMPITHMYMVLQHTPENQAALATLIERQHQKGAPEYHQWLTPQQFGQRFGASAQDIARVTEWLQSQGFTVTGVLNNNSMIAFSGTAANVRESFHTQLHYLDIKANGIPGHPYANDQDPRIPTALVPLVAGITGLHDIPLKPNHTKPGRASFDADTHRWHNNPAPDSSASASPLYTVGDNFNYDVAPQDYYTIYNVNPIFTGGHTGSSATIAVVEQSDMAYGTVSNNKATGGDVSTFRSLFGVTGTLNMYVYHGAGAATCTDPGVVEGDEVEATLDAEWANALAPNAKLIYMSCDNAAGGVIQSLAALVDQNLAQAMSMSYGHTEIGYTSADFSSLDTIYSQAAAQGQSVFVSTGDSGSDVADQNTAGTAVDGINVSALSASPYVTATGGTDFQDFYDAEEGGAAETTYWNANASSAPYGSALSYIPEMSWNDDCASSILAAFEGSTPAAYCATDPAYFAGDIVGGSGGFSTHYATPSYQTGITGYSGTKRAQPDIAMFASNGFYGHGLLFCDSDTSDPDGDGTGSLCDTPSDFGVAGGTSFVAPAMAGIAGLLDDYTGTSQGVLNYALYALGKAQFTGSLSTSCYSNGQTNNTGVTTSLPSSSCIFNDVTTSNNDEGCTKGALDCYVNSGASYGVLSVNGSSSLTIAYPSTVGYDEVSGIGTLNVANLLTKWDTAFTSSTALSASATSITTAQSVTLTATVTGGTPSGYTGKAPTLSGSITFKSGTTSVGTCTLSSGTCSSSVSGATLGAGTDSVTAVFSGSATYPTSTSTAKSITVTSSSATTTTAVTATPSTATYGESVSLKATVTASSGTATGTVTFTTGSTSLGSCTLSSGACTLATTALPFGSDTVTASYGGATGFGTSSGSTTVSVTAATTTTTVAATPTSAAYGASVSLKATVTSSGGTPTGTVTFTTGSTSLGSCTLASGSCTLATTALPVGSDPIKATYAGTTDFATSSGSTTVTVSTATTTTTVAATPTSTTYGTSVSLKATVTSSGGTPTGTVTFTTGSTSLGSCTLSGGTCTASTAATALPVGSDTVKASYGGATDFATSSGTASVTVSNAATAITITATPSSATVGENVALKAVVTSAAGTPSGGTVTFKSGTTLLGTCTVAAGTCTFSASSNGQTPATYPIVGTYGGTTNYNGSTSSSINVVLSKATPTVTVTGSPNPATIPNSVTLTATVKRPSGSSGTPTGTVTFYSGSTLIGSATLNGSGVATFTQSTSGLGAGTYPVTANYGGDTGDNTASGSTSVVLQN